MPWATASAPFIGTVTKAGVDGDGIFTLLIAAGLGVMAALYFAGKDIHVLVPMASAPY
jgi:hypothetical protein